MFNRVMLMGEVASDLNMKEIGDDKTVCNFRLKVGRDYFSCEAWNELAIECAGKLQRESRILLQGRAKSRSYEKEGQKHYVVEFVATDIEFLDKPVPLPEAF